MLRSDAREQRGMSSNTSSSKSIISVEAISEIERELLHCSPDDMVSLVFLLYDVSHTALQRLLVYQRVSKDPTSTNMNLLQEWMLGVKAKPNWGDEFLEALLICQLYGIVRKLGFNLDVVKSQYQPDNIHFNVHVNRTKKILYKLSENIDTETFDVLKDTLINGFKIDTSEYESCELVFLKLMSEKIITLNEQGPDKKPHESDFNFSKLIKIIQKLPFLEPFANELCIMQNRGSDECMGDPVAASSPSLTHMSDISVSVPRVATHKQGINDFQSEFEMFNCVNIDDLSIKSDSKMIYKDSYRIRDNKKVGFCLIINQEKFHFCNQSIDDNNLTSYLSHRKGSTFDKIRLERTMLAMNFDVISQDNLKDAEMIDCIKRCLRDHVTKSTSIFMLCIMSHGVRGHIFAANSVKVKIEYLQNIIDADETLLGIPKVLIIQACQVDEAPQTILVADSPTSNPFRLRKIDFLVYLATSPEFEAYRSEEEGSIFIQYLCKAITEQGRTERLDDIFTDVNKIISEYCKTRKVLQVPVYYTSLTKKLYLFDHMRLSLRS